MARLQSGLAFAPANAFVEVLGSRERNSGTGNGAYEIGRAHV